MKSIKISLVAALLAASTTAFAEEKSELGISANVAMTSNYVWRGMTQTNNSPAIQGGFDLDYKGFYLGTWGSNVEFGDEKNSMEMDLYLGYAGEVDKFSYDIGFIEYVYPNMSDEYNFGEAYLSLGYDFDVASLSAMYALGVDTHDADSAADDWEPTDYVEVGVSVPLPSEVALDLTYGSYEDMGENYSVSLGKSLGKFDLSLAYIGFTHDTDSDSDEDNVVATISTSF